MLKMLAFAAMPRARDRAATVETTGVLANMRNPYRRSCSNVVIPSRSLCASSVPALADVPPYGGGPGAVSTHPSGLS